MADAGPSSSAKPFKFPTTALITPSASPPVSHRSRDPQPPAKRPRLASTPSSLPSLSRSTPTSSSSVTNITNEELLDARRHSALRVLNVWSRLEERYAKALEDDDIIDLAHEVIIKDKGVLKKNKRTGFGTLADSVRSAVVEEEEPSATDYEDDEDDGDGDEIDAFAPAVQEQILKFTSLPPRKLPPIGQADPADKDDLQAFLEANKRMQFDEEDEDGSVADVLQALAEQFSSSSAEEPEEEFEGYTSFEEDLHVPDGVSLPPESSSPLSSPMITSGPLPYPEDGSEDEFAKWEEPEVVYPDLKTPQPSRKRHTSPQQLPDVIDLTSPSPCPLPKRRTTTPQVRSKSRPRSSSPPSSRISSKPTSRAKSRTPARTPVPSRPKTSTGSKSKTPIARVPSYSPPASLPQTPPRALSKAPSRTREVTPPPVASSSKVTLPTPPRSSSSIPSFLDDLADNPFLDDFPPSLPPSSSPLPPSSPIVSSVDPSPVRPRPKPRLKQRSSIATVSDADLDPDAAFISKRFLSSVTEKVNQDERSLTTPKVNPPVKPRSSASTSKPNARKNRLEVVLTRRPSRAPSIPPPRRVVSPKTSTLKVPPGECPRTPPRNKGKVKDILSDDSSPELKSKFAKRFLTLRSPSVSEDIGSPLLLRGMKRKRVLSFSSDSDSDIPSFTSPIKRIASPVKPQPKSRTPTPSPKKAPSVKPKSREPSGEPPSPSPKAKTKTKSEARGKSPTKPVRSRTPISAKAKAKSPEIIPDSEPESSPVRRSSSKLPKSTSKAVSRPKSVSAQLHSSPQTPPRRRSQSREHSQAPFLPYPAFPPMPSMPMLPAQDPQAQFHFAQAIHHLAYLMTGNALNTGTSHPPYSIPWPPPQIVPPQQIHRRRSRHASEQASSSPEPGPSRSRSDPPSTPSHTLHPYPYSYDPNWSSSTLPPSSPPRSSSPVTSSPPTSPVPLRPALRERSRSRGRRVSFKLGDDDRPHVRPGDDDDDDEMLQPPLSTPDRDRLAILASPEIPTQTKLRRKGSGSESPSPSKAKRGVSSEADGTGERGQTPGPPERSRSLGTRR